MEVATQKEAEPRATHRAPRFHHLNGARCLAAFWIVCAHYMPKNRPENVEHVEIGTSWSLESARYRVNVAVCFFVVVSGFVTHWSSSEVESFKDLMFFYLRRLGRVLVTFWLAMLWAILLLKHQGQDLPMDYVVKCFCLLEQWFKWCPNGPSWFVFALLPSWLLYPLSRKLVAFAEDQAGGSGLLALQAAAFLVSAGPGLFLLLLNGNITMQQHNDMMFWPPSQLADFLLGMTTAALVRRCRGMRPTASCPRLYGLSDLSLLIVILVVLFLPRPSSTFEMHLNGWEPMLDHGLAPLLAAFIFGSCVDDTGWASRLLAHPALVALGDLSFQVYIFQRPMHDTVGLLASTEHMDVFMGYMIVLWIFAGIYKAFVEDPVDLWIKRFVPKQQPKEQKEASKEQEYGLLSQQ